MDGYECCDVIMDQTSDVENCYVVTSSSAISMDYNLHRVRVYVEESTNLTSAIPKRG